MKRTELLVCILISVLTAIYAVCCWPETVDAVRWMLRKSEAEGIEWRDRICVLLSIAKWAIYIAASISLWFRWAAMYT